MEDLKKTVEPKKEKVKKVAPVKKESKKSNIIETNLARGFFITGFLGMVFFGLIIFNVLAPTAGIPEELFENNIVLFQTSVGLFLIGLFSFTKR
jgi:hypothetical protein